MVRGMTRVCAALATACLHVAVAGPVQAAPMKILGEAFYGEPFGIGFVEVELPASEAPEPLGWHGLVVAEKRHRAVYPAVRSQGLAGLVKDVLRDSRRPEARILGGMIQERGKAKIYFLFLGREPLELTIRSKVAHAVSVAPVEDRA